MAIPFRRISADLQSPLCAYLDFAEKNSVLYGALLIADGDGLPKEFVYNSLLLPEGVLWPMAEVRRAAAKSLAQSLFATCESTPVVLLAPRSVQEAAYFPEGFGVSLPFGTVDEERIAWVTLEPADESVVSSLCMGLTNHKLLHEPFSRLADALSEVYGVDLAK